MFTLCSQSTERLRSGGAMGRMKRNMIDREDGRIHVARLADLMHGKVDVLCWCNRCGHRAETATAMLVAQLGPDFPIPEIGTRMRCGSCGSKEDRKSTRLNPSH